MNVFKKLIRVFTLAFAMLGLTGTNTFVPVQSPNNAFVAHETKCANVVGSNENEFSLTPLSAGQYIDKLYFKKGSLSSSSSIRLSFDNNTTASSWWVYGTWVTGTYCQLGLSSDFLNYVYEDNFDYVLTASYIWVDFSNSEYFIFSFKSPALVIGFDNETLINGSYVAYPILNGNGYSHSDDEYNELQEDYNELLSSYNTLQENYNNLVTSHNELQNEYDTLTTNYNTLNSDYEALQTSYNALQTQYDNLQTLYDNLIATYTAMSGTNAFIVDNISSMRMVYNGNNINVPIATSRFLGSNVPIFDSATSFTINYNTDIFFRNGTKVALTTENTLHYDINVAVSLYDVDNNVIGTFDISIVFSEFSDNELYIGTYEFLNDVTSIRSIQFDIGNLSLNTSLGVSNFVLATTPYQRGYNDGYLSRSDDYYKMLQQYNDEVDLYNALVDEYNAYKNQYNADTEQTAYRNGVNSVNNATGGIITLIESVATVPITILNGLAPFAIWNVPVIEFIITFLFLGLIIWLVRKFI